MGDIFFKEVEGLKSRLPVCVLGTCSCALIENYSARTLVRTNDTVGKALMSEARLHRLPVALILLPTWDGIAASFPDKRSPSYFPK